MLNSFPYSTHRDDRTTINHNMNNKMMLVAPQPIDQQQPDYSFLFQPLKMKDSSSSSNVTANNVSSSNLSSQVSSGQTAISVEGCENPYIDYLNVPLSVISKQQKAPERKRKGPRGGVVVPFPVKLYDMLKGVEAEGLNHVVEWCSHGRAFMVHAAKDFVDDILPRYFKQSKLTSFQRQLNIYGFVHVTSGRDRGAYYHPLFLRGRPDICKIMLRTRVKGGADSIIPADCRVSPNQEKVSFYTLPKCPPVGLAAAADTMDESDDEDDHSASHGAAGATPIVPVGLPTMPTLQKETFPEESSSKKGSNSEDEQLPWIPPMEGSEPAQDEELEKALELLLQAPEEEEVQSAQQQQQPFYGLSLEPRPLQQPTLFSGSGLSFGQQAIPSQKVELRFPSTAPPSSQPSGTIDKEPFLGKSRSTVSMMSNDISPKLQDSEDHQGTFAGRTFTFMDDDKLNAYEDKLIESGGGSSNSLQGLVTSTTTHAV